MQASLHPDFITITCLEWKHVLKENKYKQLICESLNFLVKDKRVFVYAFVIMDNHLHMIWQMVHGHNREAVQRDFLKFTSQQILKDFRNSQSDWLRQLQVNAMDRKHQIWERNSLSIPLWTEKVFVQKLNYIHDNPIRAGLCMRREDYLYSSGRFYERQEKNWEFLTHYKG